MNQFLVSASTMVNQHGETCTYTKVTEGTYNVSTGSVTNTETAYTIKAYRKQIKATQYNYPNLVGKNALLVYMAPSTSVGTPEPNDRVTFGSDVFTVDSVQGHIANGEVCLYRLVCVKG